jgi:hypothetical protein
MPFDARRLAGRMLFDGATYDEVRAMLRDKFPEIVVDAHNSSLQAYAASEEHRRYVEAREAFERTGEIARAAAQALNDGCGVEDAVDLAEMDLTRQALELARSDGLAPGDLAKVAAALASVKRGRSKSKADELAAENARLSAQLAGVKAEMITAKELIVQLELAVERLAPSKAAKAGDAVADALGRLLGLGGVKSDKSDKSDTSDGAAERGKSDLSDKSDSSDSSTSGAVHG